MTAICVSLTFFFPKDKHFIVLSFEFHKKFQIYFKEFNDELKKCLCSSAKAHEIEEK